VPRPFGPEITFFGIATADNHPREPIGQTDDGVSIYDWPNDFGFIFVVEARPGTSNRRPAQCGLMPPQPSCGEGVRAAVQLIANRPLGNGNAAVCDVNPPNVGGVPAVPSLEFAPGQMVTDAINDLACRLDFHATSDTACTFDELDNPSYVRNRPGDPVRSTAQYCSAPVVGQDIALPPGDTRFRVQVADESGNVGSQASIVVRVR
jgi:hypothetical protein